MWPKWPGHDSRSPEHDLHLNPLSVVPMRRSIKPFSFGMRPFSRVAGYLTSTTDMFRCERKPCGHYLGIVAFIARNSTDKSKRRHISASNSQKTAQKGRKRANDTEKRQYHFIWAQDTELDSVHRPDLSSGLLKINGRHVYGAFESRMTPESVLAKAGMTP